MENIKQFILDNKIIVICRQVYGENLLNLAKALYDGGINMLEVTFDQSDVNCITKTCEAIQMLNNHFQGAMHIGAGTVISVEQVEAAKNAGAKYIISPNVDKDVIKCTNKLGLVSIPGAMTPSEILTAHNCGADIVKVFPAGYLGTRYIKDVRGPLSHIKLLAAAGINEENINEYYQAGYSGFGISGRLTDKAVIKSGDFGEFTRRAKVFIDNCNQ